METEAKFIVPDEATFARLKSGDRLGGYERRDTRVAKVHDRYVDTTDHRFYSQRFYARLRENISSGEMLLTVKRLGTPSDEGIYNRDEYQTPVQTLDVETWPEGETRDIVHRIAGDSPLGDFVTVDQTRTISYLVDGDRRIAEVSLDEVTIGTAGEPVRAYELEIELLPDGTMSDLRGLTKALTKEFKLSAQPLSKFERAMLLSHPAEADTPAAAPLQAPSQAAANGPTAHKGAATTHKAIIGLMPTDSMETAVRKMLSTYFAGMVANEEGTRSGKDVETLHDMRVATRRMRAVLRVLDPYVSVQAVGEVGRGLRSVTRALGSVRDLDVLIEDAKRFSKRLPAEQQTDLDGLLAEWSDRRKRARKELLLLLRSKEYERFKRRMEKFLNRKDASENAAQDHSGEPEPNQVRHVAGSAIWGRYEAVRAFETVIDAPTIDQLHALRVKGKYLRYTLECFRETLPPEARDLIGDIVKMQDQIGTMHDAEVAAVLIRDYQKKSLKGAKKKHSEKPPTGLDAYLIDRESVVRGIHSDFAGIWAQLGGAEWRQRLATVAAGV